MTDAFLAFIPELVADLLSGIQVDLLDVFGAASVVSEVLSDKRELSKAHIAKLSERFHLSPALFF